MSSVVHGFDWPDRFVVGTLGNPGSRTFYLQARAGDQLLSVAVEKEQSAALAQRIDEVLDELMDSEGNPFSVPPGVPDALIDNDPLELPVEEKFRAGLMSLGWDPATAQLIIEAAPAPELTADELFETEIEPEEVLQVRIPVGAARAFARRAREVVQAGRPICPNCGQPMNSAAHNCDEADELQ